MPVPVMKNSNCLFCRGNYRCSTIIMPKVKDKVKSSQNVRWHSRKEISARLTFLKVNNNDCPIEEQINPLQPKTKHFEENILSCIESDDEVSSDNDSWKSRPSAAQHFCEANPTEIFEASHNTITCNGDLSSLFQIPDEKPVTFDIKQSLAEWALTHQICHKALSSLLKILKDHPCYASLPVDARSLLRTPRVTEVVQLEPGLYSHFGLQHGIETFINNFEISDTNIDLSVSVDGLPLSKSSNSCFWPILGSVVSYEYVFIIGVYHGLQKPQHACDFLDRFVDEAVSLCSEGMFVNGMHYSVCVKHIICDAPAKSFILNVKGHTGYSSCTKCYVEGEYRERRICFADTNAQKRTDIDFLSHRDDGYHLGPSLLEKIPRFGLVTNIPLDYMHLVCLGVARKMIHLWLKGNFEVRIPSTKVDIISSKLESMAQFTPCEFVRKPRSLSFVNQWKATEFRQFLLYIGPTAVKSVLSDDVFNHFLSLHISIRLLCSDDKFSEEVLNFAHLLLVHFVTSFAILYGEEHITHNVHGLIHLVDDVKAFGSLDTFSAFKFENFMQFLKKLIRKSEKPLQQLSRRYHELQVKQEKNPVSKGLKPVLRYQHHDGPLIEDCTEPQYKCISTPNFLYKVGNKADNCCGLKGGNIVVLENIAHKNGKCYVIGREFLIKEELFTSPCTSSYLGIHIVHNLSELKIWPADELFNKYYKIPHNNKFVAVPLLHMQNQVINKFVA